MKVRLDKNQLARAKKAVGASTVTETIAKALALATEETTHDKIIRRYSRVGRKNSFAERNFALPATGKAYEKLRRLRGKVEFSVDFEALRKDRR